MKNSIKSLYIHIPFCKNICSYCDFCKMFYYEEMVDKYLIQLQQEIKSRYNNDKIETLYIGGGTPSSLNVKQLNKLFNILDGIDLSCLEEFTFEVNVLDISEELLVVLKSNRVNRISIGIETINPKYLKLIQRNHTREDVYKKVILTKKYFDNINVDFMYGFNNQTIEELIEDLEFFKSLEVNHISIYSLILEPNTKLFINNVLPLDEEVESSMYFYIIKYLEKLGYIHYEISNFAKEGHISRHNMTYWNNEHYYGFGLGASGYIDDVRYTNTRGINNYLKGNYVLEKDIMNEDIKMENEMILGLRKIKGVNKKTFYDKYNKKISYVFDIDNLLKDNLLVEDDEYIYIPKDKLYLQNSILVNFIKNL